MSRKVLIADDDPDILEAMRLILEIGQYDVTVVEDGKTIIGQMKKLKPQLVLLDIWMSGVNGLDIYKEIKKDKDIGKIPVILVSASKGIKTDAQEVGANDFLAKPFEMQDLLEKIKKNILPN